MSASEKLRALDGFGPPSNYDEMYRLQDALPQIVAVVEAAERHVDPERGAEHGRHQHDEIRVSLAALDDALLGPTGSVRTAANPDTDVLS